MGDIGNPGGLADFVLNQAYAPGQDWPDRPEGEWIPVRVRIRWRLRDTTVEDGTATQWTRAAVRVTVHGLSEPMTIWVVPSDVKRR